MAQEGFKRKLAERNEELPENRRIAFVAGGVLFIAAGFFAIWNFFFHAVPPPEKKDEYLRLPVYGFNKFSVKD